VARADYALSAFSLKKLATAAEALARFGLLPNIGWLLGGAFVIAAAPQTRRRRRGILLGAAAFGGLLLAATAFTRLDPVWLVRWTWDRLAFLLVALVIPVLAESVAEPFGEAR
jgi:hypothetical protein